jgi:putative phosphoesterase
MEKKILIVSDTHNLMPINLQNLKFDAIFHAGDIGQNLNFLNDFYLYDNFFAVLGNTDFLLEGLLPNYLKTELFDNKFFMVHNLAAPHRIIPQNMQMISEYKPNIVIFGHTHMPQITLKNDILFINPGSLGKKGLSDKRSFAMLSIDNNKPILVEITDIDTGEIFLTWKA